MNRPVSLNTQAILLLTAPLIVGRSVPFDKLLTPREYIKLARHLQAVKRQPADLLSPEAGKILEECHSVVDKDRLRHLLKRGVLMSLAIEHWAARSIWVVSRADGVYPKRIKAVMKQTAPPILYGCGDKQILNTGGLAVVGSRNIDDSLVRYAKSIGCLAAQSGRTLVSGGARGADQAAMHGALEGGGQVVGVLANNLQRTVMNHDNRNHLINQQLVLVSPYDPRAGFNVGNAMQRNKLIYAFSNAALVVSSDINRGGTWAGAIEQLDKLHFAPVYVRSTDMKGLDALQKRGANLWPNPANRKGLESVLSQEPSRPNPAPEDRPLLVDLRSASPRNISLNEQQPISEIAQAPPTTTSDEPNSPSEVLFVKVRDLLLPLLKQQKNEVQIAASLQVTKPQARDWLNRLVEEGRVDRRERPVSYVAKPSGGNRPQKVPLKTSRHTGR